MKPRKFTYAAVVFLMLLSLFPIFAADTRVRADTAIVGKLLYKKPSSTGSIQIVELSATEKHLFDISENQCYRISSNGSYIAISTNAEPSTIGIFRLQDGAQIQEIPWNNNWYGPCFFHWTADTSLAIVIGYPHPLQPGTFRSETVTFNIENGISSKQETTTHNIVCGDSWDPPDVTSCALLASQLPNAALDDYKFYWRSPNPDIVLYQNQSHKLVLYDIAHKETIDILKDTPFVYWGICDSEYLTCPFDGGGRLSWSPSGRYLAYLPSIPLNYLILSIYDVQSHQYIYQQNIEGNYIVGQLPNFSWSADNRILTFVLRKGDTVEKRNLVMAIADTVEKSLLINNDELFDTTPYDVLDWQWSPKDHILVFVNPNGNLLTYFDPTTQEHFVLDDHVIGIIDWIE